MFKIYLFLLVIIPTLFVDKAELKDFKRVIPQVNLDSKIVDTVTLLKVVFRSGFNDTLIVCSNDSIIMNEFFQTNSSTGLTNNRIRLFINNEYRDSLAVIFPNKKKYCKVPLYKGYSKLYVDIADNDVWIFNYSNSLKTLR